MELSRGIILVVSGSLLILIGNLMGSLESSGDSFYANLIHERFAKGIITENNPYSHTVWLYDKEQVTGSITTDDPQQTVFFKVVSPDGKTIFQKTFNGYLWLNFNTMLPPGEFTFIASQQSVKNVGLTLALNWDPTNIDATSKEIFKEKSFLPNLLRYTLPSIIDISGTLITGCGFFFAIYHKNEVTWKRFRTLLSGALIFVVGIVIFLNDGNLVNGLIDFSNKGPVPQSVEEFTSTFFTTWADYNLLVLLPFLVIFSGIIVVIIGGIRTLQKGRSSTYGHESLNRKLQNP